MSVLTPTSSNRPIYDNFTPAVVVLPKFEKCPAIGSGFEQGMAHRIEQAIPCYPYRSVRFRP